MEENPSTTPTEAVTPVVTEASKTPMYIGIAILVTAVVASVIIGVILLLGQGNTSGSLDSLNPGDPVAAADSLNEGIKDIVLAAASGNIEEVSTALSEFSNLERAEFSIFVNVNDASTPIEMQFDGRIDSSNKDKPAFEGTLKLTGTIPDLNLEITEPAELDMVIAGETMYLRIRNLPTDLQAVMVAFLGLASDQWYSLPLDQATDAGEGFTEGLPSASDLAELKEKLENTPIFINPTAVADRDVSGTTTKCMTVEPNPEFNDEGETESFPLEICSPENGLLPIFIGFSQEQDGVEVEVGLSLNSINSDFSVTVPEGALDLEPILEQAFGGGAQF